MNRDHYLMNPCRTSALPFWKQKSIILPPHLNVIHHQDFQPSDWSQYQDQIYFRLSHNLKCLDLSCLDTAQVYIKTVVPHLETERVVKFINACYSTLSVDEANVSNWYQHIAYDSDLRIWVIDSLTDEPIALGINDYDQELKEGSLEWIQVLPMYRNKGIGQLLVTVLLRQLKEKAAFVTVSGEVNNPTHPEKLYRTCGFIGQDLWHVLSLKNIQPTS